MDLSRLEAGQRLLLPAGKFSSRDMQMLRGLQAGTNTRRYTVRAGEAIDEIVQKRSISMQEVRKLNPGVNVHRLRGGDVLVLPERFSAREREAFVGYVPLEFLQERPPFWVKLKRALVRSHTRAVRPYTVRRGDTLASICAKRGISEADVEALNRRTGALGRLEAGQTILIPGGNLSERDKLIISGMERGGAARRYPVRRGESLEDIISKRKITKAEVERLNPGTNLNRGLRPGTTLLLPAGRFTTREKEALQGTGTVPSEYFAPASVVKADFALGLLVFLLLAGGAVWAGIKERKSIRDRARRMRDKFDRFRGK